jgi:papain like cysteine protease AvrRpt2
MTTPPAGAQMSEDGNYWWDEQAQEWQLANASPAEWSDPAAQTSQDSDTAVQAATPVAVHQSVSLVAQPTEQSCWAASIAMLLDKTPQDVVQEAGMSLDEGYGWEHIEPAAKTLGLAELAPACGTPDVLASWVQDNGPLWVVEVGAPYHAVVVAGVEGDGSVDGTHVVVYNPWPPGSGAIENPTFADFERDFELGAGSSAAILHR